MEADVGIAVIVGDDDDDVGFGGGVCRGCEQQGEGEGDRCQVARGGAFGVTGHGAVPGRLGETDQVFWRVF